MKNQQLPTNLKQFFPWLLKIERALLANLAGKFILVCINLPFLIFAIKLLVVFGGQLWNMIPIGETHP